MSDLISRQSAIDVIDKIFPADPMRNDYTQGITCGAALAMEYIKQLPSAQPDSKETSSTHKALDTISRQAVIEINRSYHGQMPNEVNYRIWKEINELPSAQPEHTSNNDCNGCKFVGCYDTDFPCANCIRKNKDYYAPERRTDEA